MDDGSSSGAAVCKGVDMSHDIVPELTFLFSCHHKVNILCMALHLLDLGVCNGETQSLKRATMKTEPQ